jgi:general secretion pathway protein B
MSLILDALRKSEAERRRGEAPGLHAPPPPVPGASRQPWRQWPIVAGGALVLLAVAILLWPRAPNAPDAPPPLAAGEATGEARAGAPVAAAPTPGPARATTTPDAGVVSAAAPRPAATDTAAVASPPPALPTAPAAVAPPPTRDEPIASVAAPVASDPPPPPSAASTEEALPTLAVLAPGERAALPALKLSMHVWNEEPARRFAIVDGQRLTEGASIGGAVVARIRRDGVELDVNGRRLLLPRP